MVLRRCGELLRQHLRPLFDGMQFTGETVPELGQGSTGLLLDHRFRGSEHLCRLFPRLLEDARSNVGAQALP
jgi:hypothetical protein